MQKIHIFFIKFGIIIQFFAFMRYFENLKPDKINLFSDSF